MASNQQPQRDMSEIASDALADYLNQLTFGTFTIFQRLYNNIYESFAQMSARRWVRLALVVIAYILVRPYIEKFFKFMHDRDRKKEMEKKKREREEAAGKGKTKKAKVSANALRGGEGGKVLGEVENTDDEVSDGENEDDEVDFATASGVPEWGKNARKRQKKYMKSLEKEAEQRTNALTEEQLMELLDWSEDEDEKKK